MIVSRLAHLAFAVSDVDVATEFYRGLFGLEVVGDDGNHRFLAGGRSRTFELALSEGEPAMEHFAFSVCGLSAFAEAQARLERAGVVLSAVIAGPGLDAGVSFALPTGHTMHLVVETDPAAFVVSSVPAGDQRRGVGPVPIEHVTLHAYDIRANAEFLARHLGLRVSESIRPAGAPRWGNTFLRAGQIHHDLGMIVNPEDRPGLHHFCFAVPSVEDLVRVSDALAQRGIALDASIGRHTSGNNVFIYFQDPFGVRVEVNTDMARVDAAAPTLVRDRPAAFDVWREGRPPAMTAGSPARDARALKWRAA